MSGRQRVSASAHSPHRLEALTDGVFAIAMTLLVLEIRIPAGAENSTELIASLRDSWPTFLSFAVSFVILGVYWLGQRSQYDYIRKVDRPVTWMNIAFLLGVSTIPFSTALAGRYPDFPFAVHVYGWNLIFCSVMQAAIWWYAADARRGLVDPKECTPDVIALGRRLSLAPILIYALAMGLSYVHARFAKFVFFVVPLLYAFDVIRHVRLPADREDMPEDAFPEE